MSKMIVLYGFYLKGLYRSQRLPIQDTSSAIMEVWLTINRTGGFDTPEYSATIGEVDLINSEAA